MLYATIPVTVTLVGPILTRSTAAGRLGLDAPMARNSAGLFYLPFSLVRGRLRQAWEELASIGVAPNADKIGTWLGPEPRRVSQESRSSWDPQRGRLRFSDFVTPCRQCDLLFERLGEALASTKVEKKARDEAATLLAAARALHQAGEHGRAVAQCHRAAFSLLAPVDVSPTRHRIRIDADRGAADDGALLMIESPFAPGERVDFTGRVDFICPNEAELDELHSALEHGFRWMPSLGAERTGGFGRIDQVVVPKPTLHEAATHAETCARGAAPEASEFVPLVPLTQGMPAAPGADVLDLVLRLKEPFCVTLHQPNRNLFTSDTVISGAVLKGSLASMLNAAAGRAATERIDGGFPEPWRTLGRHFDELRFTHAFPTQGDRRPVVPPLSLVTHDERDGKAWSDVALCNRPVLFRGPLGGRAPHFAVDWKPAERKLVDEAFGWSEPERELRVRTAIDRTERRARDKHLFAYEMVVPRGFTWRARVDLSRVTSDRDEVERQLHSIFAIVGLSGIGKTKAPAAVTVEPAASAPVFESTFDSLDGAAGRWVVTLQTPALLCDPRGLDESAGERELNAVYTRTWADLWQRELAGTGATLPALVRSFTSQSLYGGYLVKRFSRGKSYHPYLVTDPGSVFVFETAADPSVLTAVTRCLERWYRNGLPLAGWAIELHGNDPFTCPFRPEEGWGEIAVNLPCHTDSKPREGEHDAV